MKTDVIQVANAMVLELAHNGGGVKESLAVSKVIILVYFTILKTFTSDHKLMATSKFKSLSMMDLSPLEVDLFC